MLYQGEQVYSIRFVKAVTMAGVHCRLCYDHWQTEVAVLIATPTSKETRPSKHQLIFEDHIWVRFVAHFTWAMSDYKHKEYVVYPVFHKSRK